MIDAVPSSGARRLAFAALWLLSLTVLVGLAPRPEPDPALAARLAALSPDKPEAYFLLGEEVAESGTVASDKDQLELAKTLYVLAFERDRRTGHPGHLAASAAIGLARIERHEQAYEAATVLGLARSGESQDARRWRDRPGVNDTLKRYERLIGTSGETGALSRLDKYLAAWPCPECHNDRVVTKLGDRGPERRLCPTCHGNPGPVLSDEELIGQLRFEASLLNGIQRSWAAQIVVDQSAPLRDPDPDELAATYRVDPRLAYWRGGKWTDKP